MSSLQEVTEKWRQANAESFRTYDLLCDAAVEVQETKSEYARAESLRAYNAAKADYETARSAAVEARVAMTDLAARISATS